MTVACSFYTANIYWFIRPHQLYTMTHGLANPILNSDNGLVPISTRSRVCSRSRSREAQAGLIDATPRDRTGASEKATVQTLEARRPSSNRAVLDAC